MNMGCNGGLPESAFTYAIDKGFVFESEYEYTAREGNCSTEAQFWLKRPYFLNRFLRFVLFFSSGQDEKQPKLNTDGKIEKCLYIRPGDINAVVNTLFNVGPMAVALGE